MFHDYYSCIFYFLLTSNVHLLNPLMLVTQIQLTQNIFDNSYLYDQYKNISLLVPIFHILRIANL